MTIESVGDARAIFERNSVSVERVLLWVEESARDNRRYIEFEGWPSDAVVAEIKKRGFSVTLSDVLIPDTRVSW